MLFSFIDPKTNTPVAKPDRTVSVAFFDLGKDTSRPVATAEGRFVWAIQDQVGVYVADVDLPTSGLYGAEFTTSTAGGAPEVIKLPFDVRPTRSVVSSPGSRRNSSRNSPPAIAAGALESSRLLDPIRPPRKAPCSR